MEDKRNIQIIEWEHLDKKKFYVFGVAMTMMIRVSVYPFTLIRTRLQVQKGKSLYHGTFDAFIKILRADGVTGLYRGFLVNTFTLISGQCYVTTYELTRKFVADYSQSNTVKSLVAGGSASLVAQSITVPIDVVSQHLMMQRKGERMGRFQVRGSPEGRGIVAFGQTKDIIRQILRADGLRGFYRGYVASLLTYIPNSAVWWPFYHFYAVPGKWHVSLTTVGTWILLWLAGPRASADRPMEAGSSRPDATSQWPQDASFSGETGYGTALIPLS
ncbi:solute carrier family 25 member 44 isoform X9 [Eumetopias jubatus]|uniref:Solute carrier family 25 member 44 isoform X8 n=1 Tax=Callorhinus ursinus TaxID=34884 RepID=A0A3Q7PFW6_CALUR|nr:solute carrier family 25 member 44 isoform X8 [Callorhinus ursinus]XP_027945942.1 solute carrier family 25 member 44 isoform X9 [Eumetopias jubatus]